MSVLDLRKYRFIIILLILVISILGMFSGVRWVMKILYPFDYRETIKKYAVEYNIDPLLVAAVIRVESKFDKNAISYKDARGLMQIAPITGQWAAKELKIENYEENLLFNPGVNIKIGCWYLNKLNKEFDYNLSLVLAAYNGGSGNVTKWLKDKRYSDDGDTLKDIPFPETKNYVRKVTRDFKIYNRLYKDDIN